jgi:hypothetical protein
MADTDAMSETEIQEQLRRERVRLVESLDELRAATRARARAVLPLAAAGALGAGFLAGGGLRAVARLALRGRRR